MSIFQNKNLAVIAYANGWTMWQYTDHRLKYTDFDPATFFKPIHHLCGVGDKIIVVFNDAYAEYMIASLNDGNVICKEIVKVDNELNEGKDED